MKRIAPILFITLISSAISCTKSTDPTNQVANSLPTITSGFFVQYAGNVSARAENVECASSTGTVTCGVCWSTNDSPTVDLSTRTSDTITANEYAITGLSPATTYYARVFATNSAGTVYSSQVRFTTAPGFVLCQYYQGGYIYYLDNTGNHGLIVAPCDQSSGVSWGCAGTLLTGDTGTIIGSGAQNTANIVSHCADAGTAAQACKDIRLGGYSDWYLPSQQEFARIITDEWDTAICQCYGMNVRMFNIGRYPDTYYWCSTENSKDNATTGVLTTSLGTMYLSFPATNKNTLCHVRAIRSF